MEGEGQEKEAQREERQGELLMAKFFDLKCESFSKPVTTGYLISFLITYSVGKEIQGIKTISISTRTFITLYMGHCNVV